MEVGSSFGPFTSTNSTLFVQAAKIVKQIIRLLDNKAMHRSRQKLRGRQVRRMVAGSHCIRLPFSLIQDCQVGPVIANVIRLNYERIPPQSFAH